jgi:hypothetical protein
LRVTSRGLGDVYKRQRFPGYFCGRSEAKLNGNK